MNTSNGGDDVEHDPHFEPIITLPEVVVYSFEEDETILIKERAKLFRHDSEENEWKERGTGDVKLLHNELTHTVRVLMRREKTYKLCANHYLTKEMELKPSCGSDRAWVWTTAADVSDGEPNAEVLAIRFQNSTAAQRWKGAFDKAKELLVERGERRLSSCSSSESEYSVSEESQDEEVIQKVRDMALDSKEQQKELIEKPQETKDEKIEKENEKNDQEKKE